MDKKGYTIEEIIETLRYKAENIKSHIEPDFFNMVAECMEELKAYTDLKIVHCKDCMFWGTGIAGETENVKCCWYGKYMVGVNGYCVYGEKE